MNTKPDQKLNRDQEAVLLILYKYFYRSVNHNEIQLEISKDGLLNMTHIDFEAYKKRLIFERQSMLHYFDRPNDYPTEESLREKIRNIDS